MNTKKIKKILSKHGCNFLGVKSGLVWYNITFLHGTTGACTLMNFSEEKLIKDLEKMKNRWGYEDNTNK